MGKPWLPGEVAEWLNAAVSKTALSQGNEGSNPSLSAVVKSLKGSRCWLLPLTELVTR